MKKRKIPLIIGEIVEAEDSTTTKVEKRPHGEERIASVAFTLKLMMVPAVRRRSTKKPQLKRLIKK